MILENSFEIPQGLQLKDCNFIEMSSKSQESTKNEPEDIKVDYMHKHVKRNYF